MKKLTTVEEIDAAIASLKQERIALLIPPEARVSQITAYQRYADGTTSITPTPVAKVGAGEVAQFIVPTVVDHGEPDMDIYHGEEAFLKSWALVIER